MDREQDTTGRRPAGAERAALLSVAALVVGGSGRQARAALAEGLDTVRRAQEPPDRLRLYGEVTLAAVRRAGPPEPGSPGPAQEAPLAGLAAQTRAVLALCHRAGLTPLQAAVALGTHLSVVRAELALGGAAVAGRLAAGRPPRRAPSAARGPEYVVTPVALVLAGLAHERRAAAS